MSFWIISRPNVLATADTWTKAQYITAYKTIEGLIVRATDTIAAEPLPARKITAIRRGITATLDELGKQAKRLGIPSGIGALEFLMPCAPPQGRSLSDCYSDVDIATLDPLKPSDSPLFFYIMQTSGDISRKAHCSSLRSVHRELASQKPFANWIPIGHKSNVGADGHDGVAGKYRYVRFSTGGGQFLVTEPSSRILGSRNMLTDTFVLVPVRQNQRVGNTSNSFGVGRLHGQAPGFTIYQVRAVPTLSPLYAALSK